MIPEPAAHRTRRPHTMKMWEKPWFVPVTVGFVALVLGIVVGAGSSPAPVVKEVPGPERVVTKTVEKPVTPPACLKALDLSEQGFSYAGEAMGYMSDALTAAGNVDLAALKKANADLLEVSPKMKALAPTIKSATAECRAGAK